MLYRRIDQGSCKQHPGNWKNPGGQYRPYLACYQMQSNRNVMRIVLGIIIAPWVYLTNWVWPVMDHIVFSQWLIILMAAAYFVFLVLAGISHLILVYLKVTEIWGYCLVMFFVAFSLDLLISAWSLSNYESYYYSQTQVVENGVMTSAGFLLQSREALANGALSAGAMAVFWLIAIYKPCNRIQYV